MVYCNSRNSLFFMPKSRMECIKVICGFVLGDVLQEDFGSVPCDK